MLDCNALLVSTDPVFIRTVKAGIASIPSLRLEVCRGPGEALARLQRDEVALGMIQLTATADDAEVSRFVQAAAARKQPCAAVVFDEEYRNHLAVAFLRAGVADYVGLPVSADWLSYLMDTLTLRARLGLPRKPAAADLARAVSVQDPLHLGSDPETVALLEQIRRVGPQDTTLLFTGETGTGKTYLARLTHELSPRRDEPFLAIDCGALSPTLVESEMFGHVKGAFTGAERDRQGKFAAAGGGTLLLDEINSLPLPLQGKLLRAVDERAFEPVGSNKLQPLRARLIVASNRPLDREVREGRFRADLYYRLNVVGFYLAPLRERRRAIAPLAARFLVQSACRNSRFIGQIAPDALRALQEYDWPGNLRELRNVLERAVALCAGPDIQLRDLPDGIRSAITATSPASAEVTAGGPAPHPGGRSGLATVTEEAELLRITAALEKHGHNRQRAAAELGISRLALSKKLHEYGLIGAG
jgi:two-component system, NtrC family, response regulator HydG